MKLNVRSPFKPDVGRSLILLSTVVLLSVLTANCVSIPKESPELSAELGNRIAAIEKAHINLLHRFMDQKRRAVDDFVMREYVPQFAANLFAEKEIADLWTETCTSSDDAFKLEFISGLGSRVQSKINEQRLQLIRPLDEAEKELERYLRNEYAQAKSINNALTSFLASASEVAENRDRYLNMLGVDDEMAKAIDKIDKTVSTLVEKKNSAAGAIDHIKEGVEEALRICEK